MKSPSIARARKEMRVQGGRVTLHHAKKNHQPQLISLQQQKHCHFSFSLLLIKSTQLSRGFNSYFKEIQQVPSVNKVDMTDSLASLLLLLHCTVVTGEHQRRAKPFTPCMHSTVSQSCTQEGAIEIFGIETDTLIAGRLEICVGGLWRAVYDESWGAAEATLVCTEKNFTEQSMCI